MDNLNIVTVYTGNNCTGEPIMIPFMPVRPEFGQAYVPYQLYNKISSAKDGLRKGTIFPELVK